MRDYTLLDLRLDLFDGAGASAAAGDGAGAGAPGDMTGPSDAGRGEAGDTRPVLYGKQAAQDGGSPDAGEKQEAQIQTTSDALEDRRRRYRELVTGEFKDLFAEDTHRIIDRRLREAKALEQRSAQAQPILDMLMDRYKIGDGDMGKLRAAVENDDAYWSQAAEEAGMGVEQFKQFQRLQRQNAELIRRQQARIGQERADRQLRDWNDQAEQLKAVYPSFDLRREAQNRDFLSMLKAGVPVRQAFEVIHMDEIRAATAQMQARATEKAVTANIKAKGTRPQENGAGASSGFTIKDDVSRLTRKDRAEIAKRVARGEVISF